MSKKHVMLRNVFEYDPIGLPSKEFEIISHVFGITIDQFLMLHYSMFPLSLSLSSISL